LYILKKPCYAWGSKELLAMDKKKTAEQLGMLVSIRAKIIVSSFVVYLKGKSSLIIFDRHANLNTNMETGSFECVF
jgi:REP element-mobilizing transposase RayT